MMESIVVFNLSEEYRDALERGCLARKVFGSGLPQAVVIERPFPVLRAIHCEKSTSVEEIGVGMITLS